MLIRYTKGITGELWHWLPSSFLELLLEQNLIKERKDEVVKSAVTHIDWFHQQEVCSNNQTKVKR